MSDYVVSVSIDVKDAASPEDAATKAQAELRAPTAPATRFDVRKVTKRWSRCFGFDNRILGDKIEVYL